MGNDLMDHITGHIYIKTSLKETKNTSHTKNLRKYNISDWEQIIKYSNNIETGENGTNISKSTENFQTTIR